MAGAPLTAQDERDKAVSSAPGSLKTDIEARTATDWNTKPAGGTTPYTLKGHFT
jgi:hypothetical protein